MPGRSRSGRHLRPARLIPVRRWPRRVLMTMNVLVAVCLLSSGAVWGYTRYRLGQVKVISSPHLTKETSSKDSAGGLSPENILLIGNETRAGLTNPTEIAQLGSPQTYSGSLSDVIMVLHLDPAKRTASILSIPRDLFLPMPKGSPVGPYQKIDAALNDGAKGPDNLIQAITDDLGIPINHYVELNFDGFEATVNAIGGINVDFPEPVWDANSLLSVSSPGCQHLDGTQALALVRARHLQYDPPGNTSPRNDWPYDPESDLSRIVRDHTFMRILVSTAKNEGLTNPFKMNAFLGAVINQITIDPGFKSQLLDVAARFSTIDPSNVPELTMPVTTLSGSNGYHYAGYDIGDVDFPVQPADNQVIAQWDGTALPKPVAPTSVQVHNLAGTADLASKVASELQADGLPATVADDLPVPASITETFVAYPPGSLAQAMAVSAHLSGAVMLDPDSSLVPGTVAVDAGSLLSVVPPAGSSSASSSTTTVASSGGMSSGSNASSTTVASKSSSTGSPTPYGEKPSSSSDQEQPWDPRPC